MAHADANDVIDATNWSILRDMVIAAHEGDIAAARAAAFRLESDVPVDEKAGTYVFYLLRRRVTDLLQRKPTAEDFRNIADRVHSREPSVLILDKKTIENAVRTVFGETDEGGKVRGADLILAGIGILGALLDDVPAEFDAMYSDLADWYRRTFT